MRRELLWVLCVAAALAIAGCNDHGSGGANDSAQPTDEPMPGGQNGSGSEGRGSDANGDSADQAAGYPQP